MTELYEIKEWIPEMNSQLWKKYDDIDVYIGDLPNINYTITDNSIKFVGKLNNIDGLKTTSDHKYDIYKFYSSGNSNISYTKNTLNNCILIDMYYKKLNNQNIDMIDYKLLGCYRALKNTNVKKIFDKIKKIYEKQDNISIDICEKYLLSLINKKDQETKTYYVYKIYSKNDEDNLYIFGSFDDMKIKKATEYVNNMCIEFVDKFLKLEKINEHKIYVETQGLLIVDKEIQKNNTIKNGKNKFYNIYKENITVVEMEKIIFMNIQCDIMMEKLENFDCGNSGYIASINFKNNTYIFFGNNKPINQLIRLLYITPEYCENVKLADLLSKTKFNDINIKLLEKNIDENQLDYRFMYYLNKYDKEYLLNNDENNYVKKNEFNKEINNIKSLQYAILKKK